MDKQQNALDTLQKPLIFGDTEQITALRKYEKVVAFDALEKCIDCNGRMEVECSGECGNDVDCQECDAIGVEPDAYAKFKAKFGEFTEWDLLREYRRRKTLEKQ